MIYRFRKHYTREEARALLPEIRLWLKRLQSLRESLQKYEQRVEALMGTGDAVGGESVNSWVRTLAELRHLLCEFQKRDIVRHPLVQRIIAAYEEHRGREKEQKERGKER